MALWNSNNRDLRARNAVPGENRRTKAKAKKTALATRIRRHQAQSAGFSANTARLRSGQSCPDSSRVRRIRTRFGKACFL
jgi:hypothetical protein